MDAAARGCCVLQQLERHQHKAAALKALAALGHEATLYRVRSQRVPPGTDDKVLAAWNGMAIAALAEGFQVTGDARYLDAGRRAATFVLGSMRDARGRLQRTWRKGDARLNAYLEDLAYVADGVLRLFECDGDPRWLDAARQLLADVDEHFGADDGNFYFTADDHEELIARSKSVQESSQPSGVAMATLAFLRASLLLGDEALWERGMAAIRANHETFGTLPITCPGLMRAVDFALLDPREVVVAGDDPARAALLERAWRAWPSRHVVAPVVADQRAALEERTPIVTGKVAPAGEARAWVCRRGACEAPVSDPAALRLN